MVAVACSPCQLASRMEGSAGTRITASVYHPIREPMLVAWRVQVLDFKGRTVRMFPGARRVAAGEPLTIAQVWDGRNALGSTVADGTYRFTVRVRIAPATAGAAPVSFRKIAELPGAFEVVSGVGSVVVTDTPSLGVDAEALSLLAAGSLAPPPNEPGFPFNFYYGSLHNQTRYSDGGHPNNSTCAASTTHVASDFTPAQAYDYARNTAHLDFLAITDHNHLFENACSGCSGATVIQRYHDGLNAAAAATADSAFVAIYGMEWGYISNDSFPNEGHVNLFETPKLFGWESGFYEVYTDPAGTSYPAMYTAAKQNASIWGAYGSFNHPSTDFGGDFNHFGYTADGDDVIALTAVISGPASGYSTTEADSGNRYAGPNTSLYPTWASYDTYNRILGAGFHVAPVADPDVHCSNYGTSTHDRTVILATSLTKAALFDAIKNRRVYATSDHNAQIVFTLTDSGGAVHYMGEGWSRAAGPVQISGAITLHASHYDGDGDGVSSIKIFEPVPNNTAGQATLVASSTTSPLDFTFTPAGGTHAYYVYVTQADGDEIWSAPIWVQAPSAPDTTPPTAPGNLTATAGKRKITLSWTASTDNVGVTGYQIWRSANAAGPFSQLATTTATTYVNSALASGSTWFYYVKATDAAGNISAASSTASATAK